MSLRVNLEPGGIIWQARQHMATSPDTIPLDADASAFYKYVLEISHARAEKDNLDVDQKYEYSDYLATCSKDNPIGRQLTKQQDFPDGKRLTVNLSLLNESIGIMPEYERTTSGARMIGRVSIRLEELVERPNWQQACHGMSGDMDILSDGAIYSVFHATTTCLTCKDINTDHEREILNQLDLEDIYLDPSNSAILVAGFQKAITKGLLTKNQITNLQKYLHEQFPIE